MNDSLLIDAEIEADEWSKRTLYVSDEMIAAADYLARRERKRLRQKQFGAGRIVDRAMRRYVAEVMTPQEIAALGKEGA